MRSARAFRVFLLGAMWAVLAGGCIGAVPSTDATPHTLPILQRWNGDFPVADLDRLPKEQRSLPVGYIGGAATFAAVWRAFKLDEEVPEVDFTENLIVFSRNVQFYNRLSIVKVTLEDGVAEMLVIETKSAMPIEDKVAMALAIIPRAGIRFIQAGHKRTPVRDSPIRSQARNGGEVK